MIKQTRQNKMKINNVTVYLKSYISHLSFLFVCFGVFFCFCFCFLFCFVLFFFFDKFADECIFVLSSI